LHPSTTHDFFVDQKRIRFAGLACMAGGALFTLSFVGMRSVLELLASVTGEEINRLLRTLVWCTAALLLTGGSIGLLALHANSASWRKAFGRAGAGIALLGVGAYVIGSIYIYLFPDRALKQFFTPGGSILLTFGTLLLAVSLTGAGRLSRWHLWTVWVTALYFPLQFPVQASLHLGAGKGPNPVLLGAWGILWSLLGYVIWNSAGRTWAKSL
jgi:hypothetical protein